ncbi:hypothetical protein HanIR_Chr09g0415711 [Helianthus annuus]|nr:hypothetical protein HanIR_Chr09g0415711 [Helianthus annuus]
MYENELNLVEKNRIPVTKLASLKTLSSKNPQQNSLFKGQKHQTGLQQLKDHLTIPLQLTKQQKIKHHSTKFFFENVNY